MPFHVTVMRKDGRIPEVRIGMSIGDVYERVALPYLGQRPIVVGGTTLRPDEIDRVRVTYTEESADQVLRLVRLENDASRVRSTESDEFLVASRGRDVTNEFLTQTTGITSLSSVDPHRIFVVHGRNQYARDALFTFLRALGMHPLEWSEAVAATGQGAPYVGEILDAAFAKAQAIVVLMTPDDEGYLRPEFREDHDPAHETQPTGQARLNVIFEAGMAFSRFPSRTIIVEVGALRPFSDVHGRHVLRLSNASGRRQELAMRLRTAGCAVNLDGTDWHRAGDFDLKK
jgi:predicted nucleotide-binding protein